MAGIAILGYGTVGSGVFEVLQKNAEPIAKKAAQSVEIKKILDLRNFPGDPAENLITHDYNDVLLDDSISIVVETMGGEEPAYTFVKKALIAGKSVVTSNKELVAKHGAELLELARQKSINFLFEASVGGGIPIIRPLNQSLTADEITEITGVLNGTTNYILTKMSVYGEDFKVALKAAQDLGYAEKNPDADVLGYDTCRKIAILMSLAFGKQIDFEDIYTEGINDITSLDIAFANHFNCVIKLLATAKIDEHEVHARVAPVLVPNEHPISTVNGVNNAIFVKGNVIDEVMFYGKGAGKLPTASAVVADIVDAAKHNNTNIMHFWSTEKHELVAFDRSICKKLCIAAYTSKQLALKNIQSIFGVGAAETVSLQAYPNVLAFQTGLMTEYESKEKIDALSKSDGINTILSAIRNYV